MITGSSYIELSIDIVIHKSIFKNNQFKLFPCFTLIAKKGTNFLLSDIIFLMKFLIMI